MSVETLLSRLGVAENLYQAQSGISSHSPLDGALIGTVAEDTPAQMDAKIRRAHHAFLQWRAVPAPVRGELIRLYGDVLRAHKTDLGELVTRESGKILSEGLGEVQEMIDICDFAVGLSRQLYGLTIASERPLHHMREVWHPLGVVGVISAFNFPVAVWCWNFALAIVCGNATVWKPSEKTPLTALACQHLFDMAVEKFRSIGHGVPDGLSTVVQGGRERGEQLSNDKRVTLVSATGSTRMGVAVAEVVAKRLGKSLLELGGNNAMIVTPSADLNMAVRAILFGAVGTAGQRCTTLRRLIVHNTVIDTLLPLLVKTYRSLVIGNPLEKGTLVGPLIDEASFNAYTAAVKAAQDQGGQLLVGGARVPVARCEKGFYAAPTIIRMASQTDVVKHETFAPILYVMTYTNFDEAIALQNDVPQGLSSCIFTTDMREAEFFLSAQGSDCGIANVNIGPSGAEIGGAFGGEKDTGGGRESGSDSWKAYMRRQTQTVNFSSQLPLAQGVEFPI
jgi:aldehyde dehydrogenase (NAD+)